MERPLVSVVLCTFNGARFLASQLDSIFAQTYQPFELVISDDASTDDTCGVIGRYLHHSQIRFFKQEKNLGLTQNFSFAAAQSTGKYIAFSDQDDIWMPNKLERLLQSIGEGPLVYSNSLLVDEDGNSLGKKLSDLKRMYSGNDSRGYILYSCVWGHGMMITRHLFEQSLPMPGNVHHDIWLTYQAFQHGGIRYLDEVLTHYRQHPNSASKTLPAKIKNKPKDFRYRAYKSKLDWIRLMQQFERPEYQPFYQRLTTLFADREKKAYVFPLVAFMLRYRKYFFMLSTKGMADNIIEIIKYGKGEKSYF